MVFITRTRSMLFDCAMVVLTVLFDGTNETSVKQSFDLISRGWVSHVFLREGCAVEGGG